MIVVAILAVYALAAAVLLPRLLTRAHWSERAPRLAIAMWLAACSSVVASAVMGGLAAAIPPDAIGHGLAGLFEACAALLAAGFDTAASSWGARAALLLSGLIVARTTYCLSAVLFTARRERARHAEMLSLVGRHDGDLGAIVLDHGERLAYCLPGRQGKTVITTGALQSLAPAHVAAVLAHERAHLRGRHHLVLAVAEAFARACPRVPLFARAKSEVVRLIELLADDVAARHHPRAHIAAALVGLATGRVPAFALGAGGETALTRVRRMLNPAVPLHRREKLAGMAAVGALLAGPTALAAIPGLSSFVAHHCHALSLL
ncbi:M56 family metallopeptidase [Nonomuraea endophytica]|uniref:M56 family metallopeptidase n=1 Tax=Nonomuraea endophytica TaxID=714136 RepID=UPI0037C8FBC7